MIEVKDRIPKKPNRILITPENGSAPFYATWQKMWCGSVANSLPHLS